MLEETWAILEMVTVSLVTVIHKANVYNVATLSQVVIIEVGEAPLLHIKEEVHITIDDDAPDVPRKKDFYEAFLVQQKMIMTLQNQLKFFADYVVESEERSDERRRLKELETHQSAGLVSMITDLAARVKVQEAHHNRGLVPATADLPLAKKGGIKAQNDGVVPSKLVKEKKTRAKRPPKPKPMIVFDGPALPVTRVPKKPAAKRVVIKSAGKPESYIRQLFGSNVSSPQRFY